MNVSEGYASVKVGGRSFELTPSFYNINKIGSPSDIIRFYKSINRFEAHPIQSFSHAITVLHCCGIDDYEITGCLDYSERQKCNVISPGKMPVHHVMALAKHCMRHGIVGSNDQVREADEQGSSKPMTKFNPYRFVVSCAEFLGLSHDEAWGLTMTKYINIMEAKIESMEERGEIERKPGNKDVKMILERHRKLVSERDKKRAQEKSKESSR